MVYIPSPEIYDCLVKARNGDDEAAREALKLYRLNKIAREIKKGTWSNRAKRAVEYLTAGVTVEEWDYVNSNGSHTCLLINRPPLSHELAPRSSFDD